MQMNDLVIFTGIAFTLIGGIAFGIRANKMGLVICQRIVIGMLVLFLADIIAGVLVAGREPSESYEPLRLLIFWIAYACGCISVYVLMAGLTTLLRKDYRKMGVILAVLSLLIVPIFFFIVVLAKMLR